VTAWTGWILAAFLIGFFVGAWTGVKAGKAQVIAHMKASIPKLSAEVIARLKPGDVTIQLVDVNGDIIAEGSTKKPSGLH
jgi:hypothetical protein